MKINKLIVTLCLMVMMTIITNFTCLAADIEFPREFEPVFFTEFREYTIDDVILSEDGKWIIGIKEPEVVVEIATESNAVIEEGIQSINSNRWGITLTNEERDVLAKIVDLEAGNQCDLGQQAVVEVIFNRVTHSGFNNDVIGVLSERGQFSTWSYRHKGTPDARTYANIDAVVNGQTNIFPSNTVFFSRGAQNKRIQTRIEDHVFCNA